MTKKTKIITYIASVIALIIILSIILGLKDDKEVVVNENVEVQVNSEITIEIIDDTVYLKDENGVTHDTLSISEEFGDILEVHNSSVPAEVLDEQKFITAFDINYDGTNDVAVLDGIGYGGVNYFYNYFIVNPETIQFEDYRLLPHVANFSINTESQTITSSYRSGPQRYADEYTFVNNRYLNTSRTQLQ